MEVENGYLDVYLQRNPAVPDVKYEWVWELKYIKKGDDEKILQSKRDEAHRQLDQYRHSQYFSGRTDVRFASILFIGKDKYEIREE
ncbi:hypothetical protein FACS189437_08680 [Bacteroidia bacterium]|nr:hypothetical protein FACS189437_08680 [Bacteroidia bacterium]